MKRRRSFLTLTLAASAFYAVSGGIRSNYGIILGPICENSAMDYASVSFVLALSQLVFGILQPVFGLVSMRKSDGFVLKLGTVLLAAGLLLIPWCKNMFTLILVLGLILPAGTAALSFGLLMGIITPQLPPDRVSTASGIVTASCGVGSTVLSPLISTLCAAVGLLGCMLFLGIPSLLLIPVAVYLCGSSNETLGETAQEKTEPFSRMARQAFGNIDYRYLLIGFFTCGFHMAIIETHLYTEIGTYGYSNTTAALVFSVYGVMTMVGSVISGMLCSKFPMQKVLGSLYFSRVVMVLGFLLLPKNLVVIFAYAILLGLTGNATVPPTSGLTEKLFGAAKLATLFGIVFLSHQIGSFFSAWFGGICLEATGGYTWIWMADIILSAMAAFVSFRIHLNETRSSEAV